MMTSQDLLSLLNDLDDSELALSPEDRDRIRDLLISIRSINALVNLSIQHVDVHALFCLDCIADFTQDCGVRIQALRDVYANGWHQHPEVKIAFSKHMAGELCHELVREYKRLELTAQHHDQNEPHARLKDRDF